MIEPTLSIDFEPLQHVECGTHVETPQYPGECGRAPDQAMNHCCPPVQKVHAACKNEHSGVAGGRANDSPAGSGSWLTDVEIIVLGLATSSRYPV